MVFWASKHLWGNIYFAGDGTCFIKETHRIMKRVNSINVKYQLKRNDEALLN